MSTDLKVVDVTAVKKAGKSRVPKRFIVTVLAFFGLFNASCMKVCVSVAIVAMVNHTHIESSNNISNTAECPALVDQEVKTEEKTLKGERYNWDPIQQGLILSAFFYGYFISMLPGGYMADRLGPVKVFGCCIFSTSFFTLLTPLVVQWGSVAFILLRFLAGFGEGATYPAVLAIVSRWSPKLERSRITSIILTGGSLGMVFSFSVSGLLCASEFLGGWPAVFYVFGTIGCLWYFLWVIFVYETPDVHPTITKEEITKFKDVSFSQDKKQEVPWKSILTSVPVWALLFACIGNNFGYIMLMTQVPTYLNSILHFNIKASGSLSSLPYVSQTVGAWISSFIADKLRSSGKLKITLIRKVFSSIAGYGPAICILTITFSGCRSHLIVVLLTLGNFLNGFKYSGFIAASVDMTPDFVGIIYGLTSGMGNIAGIIGPTMFGAIIANGGTIANWSKVFMTVSGIYFFTTSIFAIFGSSELQPWNRKEPVSVKEENS